jgi:hypothetical protein
MVTDHVLITQSKSTTWNTVAGTFQTMVKTTVTFKLPTLHEAQTIETEIHVTNSINNYHMIVGQDLLQELGIVLHFADQTIVWDHATMAMKNNQSLQSNDIVAIESESPAAVKATERMKQILEAKYEQVDIKNVVAGCKHLSTTEQQQLFAVLNRFQSLFDGTLGHWKYEHYDITLQPNVKPYHTRPYPIPKICKASLKIEYNAYARLVF